MQQYSANWHTSYPAFHRHWHSGSEKFAGGDALLTALDDGWEVSRVCYLQEYWLAGTRLVTAYHFDLRRGEELMTMPVITTPYVRRIIREQQFQVLPVAERDDRQRQGSTN